MLTLSDPTTNLTEAQIDAIIHKANERTLELLVPTACFLVTLSVLGSAGNSLSIYIFVRKMRRNLQNSLLLLHCVLSLLLCSACIPFDLCDVWYAYVYPSEVLCKISRFSNTCFTGGQNFALIVLAFIRFRSVCCGKPVNTRTAYVITGVLFSAISLSWTATVVYGYHKSPTHDHGVLGRDCSVSDDVIGTAWPPVYNILLAIGFAALLFFTVFCYYKIWSTVKKSRITIDSHRGHEGKRDPSESEAARFYSEPARTQLALNGLKDGVKTSERIRTSSESSQDLVSKTSLKRPSNYHYSQKRKRAQEAEGNNHAEAERSPLPPINDEEQSSVHTCSSKVDSEPEPKLKGDNSLLGSTSSSQVGELSGTPFDASNCDTKTNTQQYIDLDLDLDLNETNDNATSPNTDLDLASPNSDEALELSILVETSLHPHEDPAGKSFLATQTNKTDTETENRSHGFKSGMGKSGTPQRHSAPGSIGQKQSGPTPVDEHLRTKPSRNFVQSVIRFQKSTMDSDSNKGENRDGQNTTKRFFLRTLSKSDSVQSRKRTAESAISFTAFLLTFTYIVSYLPFFVVSVPRLMDSNFDITHDRFKINLVNLCLRFYFIASAVNPLIFLVSNVEFRKQFKSLRCCH